MHFIDVRESLKFVITEETYEFSHQQVMFFFRQHFVVSRGFYYFVIIFDLLYKIIVAIVDNEVLIVQSGICPYRMVAVFGCASHGFEF